MVTYGQCPFGGTAGSWVRLNPAPPPTRGCRVIPGAVWWSFVFWHWRLYSAARAAGIVAVPPTLARAGVTSVYITDQESLRGVLSPADFARRVGLPASAQAECQLFGCAMIEFDIPNPTTNVIAPPQYPGTQQGLTVNGAREWLLTGGSPLQGGNLPLDAQMKVIYVEFGSSGPRYFELPL